MTLTHAFGSRSVLTTTLALLAISGCDLAPTGEADMDADSGDVGDAGDDEADDGSDDGDGEGDGGGGDDAEPGGSDDGSDVPGDDAPAFDNQTGPAFAALDGMMFVCSEAEDVHYQVIFEAGAIEVRDRDGATLGQGSYTASEAGVTLSLPDLGFQESSIGHEIELDVVATFTTPSLFCHAVALDVSPNATSTFVKCPDIRYIPGTSYQHHEFHFWTDGSVKRRAWTELLDINDTLYSESWGIHVQLGDRVFMFFGDSKDERLLTGWVDDSGLYIDQLEPEAGPCT